MGFYADLHVHSKYSRATSRDCDLEHMAYWARKKGVGVVGTGDFTHKEWFKEIEEKLVPAEPGLFRLRDDLEREIESWLSGPTSSASDRSAVRFMLEVEISTIYKKDDQTRKVHHLIYAPDLEKARKFSESLGRIGNIASDGRPILGLDSRDLLEIALESGEGCYLIPAHIWTPWFAVLGSKSGFDTIEHCYGDLTSEIFAVETGLSSDPAMNWRLSMLDRYTLVSNSDAHSPPKIGREACAFNTDMDYFAMRRALETGNGYDGTVEFFAEEGKYHLDGHRKCGVCLTPEESRAIDGACPVCGKPLTLGVMHRVSELADRKKEKPPEKAARYRSFVPLEEVLSEIQGVGPKSKAVQRKYESLVSRLGSELFILEDAPVEDVERAESPLVAEALARMREGRVIRQSGYDGEYGTIRLFSAAELEQRTYGGLQTMLFGAAPGEPPKIANKSATQSAGSTKKTKGKRAKRKRNACAKRDAAKGTDPATENPLLQQLDPDQRRAAEVVDGPLVIVAGPGTGKTRTLTHRLAYVIDRGKARADECLAITFTNRAADEMDGRLRALLPKKKSRVGVMTFHRFGLALLQEHCANLGLESPVHVATDVERATLLSESLSVSKLKAHALLKHISRLKRDETKRADVDEKTLEAFNVYNEHLRARSWVDFDDLITLPVRILSSDAELLAAYRNRYRWICVDEFQDIDATQYDLIKLLVPADGNLCVIGDPDQSIYGFRGADVRFFEKFHDDYPMAPVVSLTRNYRSTNTIVDAAVQMIRPESLVPDRLLSAQEESTTRIEIHECASDRGEAEFVVHTIERMIGGSTLFSLDSGRVEPHEGEALSFGDFAVLYRTDRQADALVEALARSGIPFQKRSHRPLAEVDVVRQAIEILVANSSDSPEASGRTPPESTVEPRDFEQWLAAAVTQVREESEAIDHYAPQLQSIARKCSGNLADFLAALALGVDVDFWDPRAEGVSLLTLHAAKGLEFPVVFVAGCEDGIVPLRWNPNEENSSEERRLFFVGMTRAREHLLLTHARRRLTRGKVRPAQASPFLGDIEERLLEVHAHRANRKRSDVKQLTLFGE